MVVSQPTKENWIFFSVSADGLENPLFYATGYTVVLIQKELRTEITLSIKLLIYHTVEVERMITQSEGRNLLTNGKKTVLLLKLGLIHIAFPTFPR